MSSLTDVKRKCYVCGQTSDQAVLASTNRFGAPDLDLRPPEMERSTMGVWIQKCPYCGYVAIDIRNKTSITLEYLKGESFLSCENRKFKSKLAGDFYKQYMISIADDDVNGAFQAALNAAWVCDDKRDVDNAIYCREKALIEIEKLIASTKQEVFWVARMDLLRRVGKFDLLIDEYQGKIFSEELLNQIVAFQIEKAKQKDIACYTVADACAI